MDAPDITDLLGSASTSSQIADQLRLSGIADLPHVKIDHGDPDGPVVEAQDWLLSARSGIEFGFEDEASWLGLDSFHLGRGPMLLTQIYFYGGDREGIAPFSGRLPCGLQTTDDRGTVRSRLAKFEKVRRSHVRDTWELPEFRMTVSYSDDGARIDFVLCTMRPERLPPLEPSDADLPTPSIESIIQVLGLHWFDPAFRKVFVPLGFDKQLDRVLHGKTAELRHSAGLELAFHRMPLSLAEPSQIMGSPVLSHVVLYRDRELEARGWQGTLPMGIGFEDGPEEALQKVGRPPDEHSDTEFSGFMLWHLADYSLHVYYGTMDNLVLRVRIIAPGVWASYKGN